jgi:hypothetical protein
MRRGPGHIERAIRGLFDVSPHRAFLTADLVRRCFPGVDRIERKHEVSVLRAARKIVASDPDWCSWRREWGSIFFNHANLQSYALFEILRSEGRLDRPCGSGWDYPDGYDWRCWRQDPKVERASAVLNHPHCQAHMTPPDGSWWRAVQLHCAERDGDEMTATPLRLEAERRSADNMVKLHAAVALQNRYTLGGMFRNSMLVSSELLAVAADLHELAKQNDPDVVREGLLAAAKKLAGLAEPDLQALAAGAAASE